MEMILLPSFNCLLALCKLCWHTQADCYIQKFPWFDSEAAWLHRVLVTASRTHIAINWGFQGIC
jgi:hypothetical protein